MKISFSLAPVAGLLLVFVASARLLAQGDLIPPGPPAPTMKSLEQIEARVPVSSLPFVITESGSYYLTQNLSVSDGDGITINASQVTLDLNGFSISSSASPAGGTAILLDSEGHEITILNGHITGAFQHGIKYPGFISQLKNVKISRLSVTGASLDGIHLGAHLSNVVDHCTVQQVGGAGITAATVTDSVANACGSTGISALSVANSTGNCSTSQRGISARTALNSIGTSATGTGLEADSANGCWGASEAFLSPGNGLNAVTASGCYGNNFGGSGTGLSATNAHGSYGASGSGTGLSAINAQGCYGSSGSGIGLYAERSVANSTGVSTSGVGLQAGGFDTPDQIAAASNCTGVSSSGSGLDVGVALNCVGISDTGRGLLAFRTASSCFGKSDSNIGLQTFIAIGCTGFSESSIPILATNRYLMPDP